MVPEHYCREMGELGLDKYAVYHQNGKWTLEAEFGNEASAVSFGFDLLRYCPWCGERLEEES